MGNAKSTEETETSGGDPLEASFDASEIQVARAVFDVLSAEGITGEGSKADGTDAVGGKALGKADAQTLKPKGEEVAAGPKVVRAHVLKVRERRSFAT
eukprot:990510-Pyramimonas_sp.AAC.1